MRVASSQVRMAQQAAVSAGEYRRLMAHRAVFALGRPSTGSIGPLSRLHCQRKGGAPPSPGLGYRRLRTAEELSCNVQCLGARGVALTGTE